MSQALDNLSELIDRHLPAQGYNREDLAKILAVSPSTLSRWSSRMPGPETVRALAAALDQPYAVVLAAALRSGGYVETTTDILAGHRLTLVARDPACAQDEDEEPGAVFTDPEDAKRWARVREDLDMRYGGYGHGQIASGTAVIDGSAIPRHVTVFRAAWEHRADRVTVEESGFFAEAPTGLDPHTAHVEALSDSGKVFAVSASGLDAAAARQTVEAAVSRLREEGRLLGTGETTGLHLTDRLMHSELASIRDYAQPPGDHEPTAALAARERISEFMSKFPDPQVLLRTPYKWGGESSASTEPWRDPITTYTMRP